MIIASRYLFRLDVTLSVGRQNHTRSAPHPSFDAEAKPLELRPYLQTVLARAHEESQARAGAKEWRDLIEDGFNSMDRALTRDHPDAVLRPSDTAYRRRAHAKEATPP